MIVEGTRVLLRVGRALSVCSVQAGRTVNVGKVSFKLDNLIGTCMGSKFEVVGKDLVPVSNDADAALPDDGEVDVAVEDNRNLVESRAHQSLSQEDVLQLKQQLRSEDLVGKLVENSVTFKEKTVFAQEKYIRKKIKKHASIVATEHPSIFNVTEMLYVKNAGKLNQIRGDTVAMMLLKANIHAGERVLVVDTCQGLVAAAAVERLGGEGLVMHLHSGDNAPSGAFEAFGFPPEIMKSMCAYTMENMNTVLSTLDGEGANDANAGAGAGAGADGDVQAMDTTTTATTTTTTTEGDKPVAELEGTDGVELTGLQKRDMERRKREAVERAARRARRAISEAHLREGNFDALLVATRFHPTSIVETLLPFLKPSATMAIYSPYLEPLVDTFSKARGAVVNLQIAEIFLRESQVLPSRTHPHMNMNGASGFILSGIKVLNEDNGAKRSRTDDDTVEAQTTTTTTTTTTTPPPPPSTDA